MNTFYCEPITVTFASEPLLEKKPGPPSAFVWRETRYSVTAVLKMWHDYSVRGTLQSFYNEKRGNAPEMTQRERGSWGVGRDYYRVETDSGEIFDVYYDRAPRKHTKGEWILLRKVGP
ncbi:MAG: hypothetical protein HXS52_01630 [Theionarchaea archaeon]|nr:hypothetical protein [Theionarchaea archaeon]MBU7036604.1 hypothetical protein [Theionarchaea archaeon]